MEGICADCGEHCETLDEVDEENEEPGLSNCCGATVMGEGCGFDEDYGQER